MLRRVLGHVRHNVVAYLALFIALGGTSAYAAATITGADIVDGSVSTADITNDNVGFGGLNAQDLNVLVVDGCPRIHAADVTGL